VADWSFVDELEELEAAVAVPATITDVAAAAKTAPHARKNECRMRTTPSWSWPAVSRGW
jgi:hypothetical protein